MEVTYPFYGCPSRPCASCGVLAPHIVKCKTLWRVSHINQRTELILLTSILMQNRFIFYFWSDYPNGSVPFHKLPLAWKCNIISFEQNILTMILYFFLFLFVVLYIHVFCKNCSPEAELVKESSGQCFYCECCPGVVLSSLPWGSFTSPLCLEIVPSYITWSSQPRWIHSPQCWEPNLYT